MLVEHKADLELTNPDGLTPLLIARQEKKQDPPPAPPPAGEASPQPEL